jgi:hypothetical protein
MSRFRMPDSYYDPPDDPPLVTELSSKVVVARKPHKCDACGKGIAAGEKYKRIVFKNDEENKIEMLRHHAIYCFEDYQDEY